MVENGVASLQMQHFYTMVVMMAAVKK